LVSNRNNFCILLPWPQNRAHNRAQISPDAVNFSCPISGPWAPKFQQTRILSLTIALAERGEVMMRNLGGPSSIMKHDGVGCHWERGEKTLIDPFFFFPAEHTTTHTSLCRKPSLFSLFWWFFINLGAWRSDSWRRKPLEIKHCKKEIIILVYLLNSTFYLLVIVMICVYWRLCMVSMCNMS
jgi:hypothetical protein